jgi:Flp pilus assembly protein TadG
MRPWRRIPSRERSKGVAVIELALSLLFLVPVTFAAIDFGYYFYVGANAEEAAQQGLRQALRRRATLGANCDGLIEAPIINTIQNSYATVDGPNCLGGILDNVSAVHCYMNQPPLAMGGIGGPTQVTTLTCDGNPAPNSWHITVEVSFPLAVGLYRALLPAGSGPGTVRYRVLNLTASP